jgi:hypothetical protein
VSNLQSCAIASVVGDFLLFILKVIHVELVDQVMLDNVSSEYLSYLVPVITSSVLLSHLLAFLTSGADNSTSGVWCAGSLDIDSHES